MVLSVSVATCTAYRIYPIRTCAHLTFIFLSEVYQEDRCAIVHHDVRMYMILLTHSYYYSLVDFFPEVFFPSRVIIACPATTGCIL